MKGIIFAILLVVCFGVSSCGNVFNDQLGVKGPAQEIGAEAGLNDDPTFFAIINERSDDELVEILEEDDGNIIIVGNLCYDEPEQVDAWIIKTDKFGNILQQKAIGGKQDNRVFSIGKVPDGGYLLAGYSLESYEGDKDFWIVKLSSSLDMLWERHYGNEGNDLAKKVFQEDDGEYVIIGCTDRFGAGGNDVWVIWTDAEGEILGETTHGLKGNETIGGVVYNKITGKYVIAINTFEEDNIFLSGVHVMEVDSSGTPYRSINLHGGISTIAIGMIVEDNGDMVIVGRNYDTSLSNFYTPWAIKLNSQLQVVWETVYLTVNDGIFINITKAKDGSYMLGGVINTNTKSGVDMLMTQLNANGTVKKMMTAGGESTDTAYTIKQLKSGGVIIAGESDGFGCEGIGIFFTTMDESWRMDQSGLNVIEWYADKINVNTQVEANPLTAMKDMIQASKNYMEKSTVTETNTKSIFIR